MNSTTIGGILVLTVSIGLTACVGLETKTRVSHDQQRISEEDITDNNAGSASADRQGANRAGMEGSTREGDPGTYPWPRGELPEAGSPPSGYSEHAPDGDADPPPPRRFKWQDRRGNERGWEIKNRTEESRQ